MPFKTFVAGEILTASDVMVFLANQAIAVFADATARDAAITSPVEGQFAFRTDDDVLEYWDGSAWEEYVTTVPVDYVVISGGGGGGGSLAGGGSGAGEFNESSFLIDPSNPKTYSITIGAGGAPVGTSGNGLPGSFSIFADTTSRSGGFGRGDVVADAGPGGSGGGGSGTRGGAGGASNKFFVAGFGNSGGAGNGTGGVQAAGGGGGGAGAAGGNGASSVGGTGGAGRATSISGSSQTFAGGGGGGTNSGVGGGSGGSGGGGNGGQGTGASAFGQNGAANTGSGAGGAGNGGGGGTGGSGIVIFRLDTAVSVSFSGGVTQTNAALGDKTVYTVTAAGPTDTVTIG